MSLAERASAAKSLVNILKRWPDDTKKIYSSFVKAQIALYEGEQSALPSADVLRLRSAAANALVQNKHKNEFKLQGRLYYPDGNKYYYKSIVKEANGESKRANPFMVFLDVTRGWWK